MCATIMPILAASSGTTIVPPCLCSSQFGRCLLSGCLTHRKFLNVYSTTRNNTSVARDDWFRMSSFMYLLQICVFFSGQGCCEWQCVKRFLSNRCWGPKSPVCLASPRPFRFMKSKAQVPKATGLSDRTYAYT